MVSDLVAGEKKKRKKEKEGNTAFPLTFRRKGKRKEEKCLVLSVFIYCFRSIEKKKKKGEKGNLKLDSGARKKREKK